MPQKEELQPVAMPPKRREKQKGKGPGSFRIIVAVVVFLAVAHGIHSTGTMISMDYYKNANYYLVWSPAVMSLVTTGAGTDFYYTQAFISFMAAVFFVMFYAAVGRAMRGSAAKKGLTFGLFVFLIATIPYSLTMLLMINLPLEIVILWAFENLVIYIMGGVLTGSILKIRSY